MTATDDSYFLAYLLMIAVVIPTAILATITILQVKITDPTTFVYPMNLMMFGILMCIIANALIALGVWIDSTDFL